MGTFEYFDHAADVGIQILAESLPDLFCTAARALMEWMGPSPESWSTHQEDVQIAAEDLEDLLVRWLQELLYLFHQRHAYLTDVPRIQVTERRLDATVTARIWDASSVQSFQEVKAVTYHGLRVAGEGAAWHARVILDI